MTEKHKNKFREERGESEHRKKYLVIATNSISGTCFSCYFSSLFSVSMLPTIPDQYSIEPSMLMQSSILTAGEASIISSLIEAVSAQP